MMERVPLRAPDVAAADGGVEETCPLFGQGRVHTAGGGGGDGGVVGDDEVWAGRLRRGRRGRGRRLQRRGVSGTQMKTTSDCSAAARGRPPQVAPLARRGSALARVRV